MQFKKVSMTFLQDSVPPGYTVSGSNQIRQYFQTWLLLWHLSNDVKVRQRIKSPYPVIENPFSMCCLSMLTKNPNCIWQVMSRPQRAAFLHGCFCPRGLSAELRAGILPLVWRRELLQVHIGKPLLDFLRCSVWRQYIILWPLYLWTQGTHFFQAMCQKKLYMGKIKF